jgi:hypothetical protein
MDGQQTRPLVYAGSYTACCEGEASGGGSPQTSTKKKMCSSIAITVLKF